MTTKYKMHIIIIKFVKWRNGFTSNSLNVNIVLKSDLLYTVIFKELDKLHFELFLTQFESRTTPWRLFDFHMEII